MSQVRAVWKDFDWLLLFAALAVSSISLTEIYSATINTSGETYLIKQLIWVLAGICLMFLVTFIDYRVIAENIPWIYLGSLAVLIYTRVTARPIAGARSWIEIGPLTLQPSEFIKMVVVVAMARYLADLHVDRHMNLNQILRAAMIAGVPMALIALQPDLGTLLTYLPILGVGLFLRGIRARVLVVMVLILALAGVSSWSFLKPYQKERILTFMDPERDPQGAGYQVIQSRIAIGSGGLAGKGVFEGTQSRLGFLPTTHTDFIFSVVGEELGFLGVLLTLGLFGFILLRSLYNAQTARDTLGLFIIMGVAGIYFFHIVVNVAMVIGFMPTTGIPLPFMSYGGSSILTAFIGLGLIINVRRRRYVN